MVGPSGQIWPRIFPKFGHIWTNLGQKWAISEGGWPLFGLFLKLLSTLRPDIFTNLPNQPYPLYSGVLDKIGYDERIRVHVVKREKERER